MAWRSRSAAVELAVVILVVGCQWVERRLLSVGMALEDLLERWQRGREGRWLSDFRATSLGRATGRPSAAVPGCDGCEFCKSEWMKLELVEGLGDENGRKVVIIISEPLTGCSLL